MKIIHRHVVPIIKISPLNPRGEKLFNSQSIPNPAKEDYNDQPLTESVFDIDLASVGNGVAIGIGYGNGNIRTAFLCTVNLAVFVNTGNGRI